MKQVKQLKKVLKKKTFLTAALVIVALSCSAGAWWWYSHNDQGVVTSPPIVEEEYTPEQELADAKKQLEVAKTKDERAQAYQKLSNVYANRAGEQVQAVTYAQKMVEEDPQIDSYGQLGYAAEQAGDYKKAAEAYKKAASLATKTSADDARSDYNYYSGRAQQMESR
ncbi:MAG: hypothetical protein JWM00_50 [Candidatus Saccharibacteria bacterium]|nr:hypothetical protein [Candidatus Saccharibacteria bacterium]